MVQSAFDTSHKYPPLLMISSLPVCISLGSLLRLSPLAVCMFVTAALKFYTSVF